MHPKSQLDGTGIRPKRSFGQNFLVDDTHLRSIARVVLGCAHDPARTVMEWGAGLGALTAMLLTQGATLHAVERDRDLVPLLRARFARELADGARLIVHEDNALTIPLDDLPAGAALCGNLPYHLAASLCFRALDAWPRLGGAAFLVQLEVGERIVAGPGTKDYGVLSVLVQSRFDVALPVVVPKGAFWPVPDVDGGLVELVARAAPRGEPASLSSLQAVVKPAFQQRRKTLRNALSRVLDEPAIVAAGVDPKARAEEISVEGFSRLAMAFQSRVGGRSDDAVSPDVEERHAGGT